MTDSNLRRFPLPEAVGEISPVALLRDVLARMEAGEPVEGCAILLVHPAESPGETSARTTLYAGPPFRARGQAIGWLELAKLDLFLEGREA